MNSEELKNQIEQSVASIESKTSAEVVVSFHQSSDKYRDIDLVWALLFALCALAYKIWAPYNFDANWVPFNVVLCGLLGFALSSTVRPIRRLLISNSRLDKCVLQAARAQFLELGVNQTREQTGLLLYVSRFERRLLFVPDLALSRELNPGFWEELHTSLGRPKSEEEFLGNVKVMLDKVKAPLQRHLPARHDDTNELPDRPVEFS